MPPNAMSSGYGDNQFQHQDSNNTYNAEGADFNQLSGMGSVSFFRGGREREDHRGDGHGGGGAAGLLAAFLPPSAESLFGGNP